MAPADLPGDPEDKDKESFSGLQRAKAKEEEDALKEILKPSDVLIAKGRGTLLAPNDPERLFIEKPQLAILARAGETVKLTAVSRPAVLFQWTVLTVQCRDWALNQMQTCLFHAISIVMILIYIILVGHELDHQGHFVIMRAALAMLFIPEGIMRFLGCYRAPWFQLFLLFDCVVIGFTVYETLSIEIKFFYLEHHRRKHDMTHLVILACLRALRLFKYMAGFRNLRSKQFITDTLKTMVMTFIAVLPTAMWFASFLFLYCFGFGVIIKLFMADYELNGNWTPELQHVQDFFFPDMAVTCLTLFEVWAGNFAWPEYILVPMISDALAAAVALLIFIGLGSLVIGNSIVSNFVTKMTSISMELRNPAAILMKREKIHQSMEYLETIFESDRISLAALQDKIDVIVVFFPSATRAIVYDVFQSLEFDGNDEAGIDDLYVGMVKYMLTTISGLNENATAFLQEVHLRVLLGKVQSVFEEMSNLRSQVKSFSVSIEKHLSKKADEQAIVSAMLDDSDLAFSFLEQLFQSLSEQLMHHLEHATDAASVQSRELHAELAQLSNVLDKWRQSQFGSGALS